MAQIQAYYVTIYRYVSISTTFLLYQNTISIVFLRELDPIFNVNVVHNLAPASILDVLLQHTEIDPNLGLILFKRIIIRVHIFVCASFDLILDNQGFCQTNVLVLEEWKALELPCFRIG